MTKDDPTKAAAAAFAVMKALEPLSADDRHRVLQAAAALYSVSVTPSPAAQFNAGAAAKNPANENGGDGGSARASNKRMSIGEFLQEKAAITNLQRIACFAHYREHVENMPNFSSSDLKAYFPLAKLPAPGKNYGRDYNNVVKAAWIHDEGAKSYLTQKGEDAVKAGFGGKGKPRGATAGKKRKGAKAE